MDSIETEAPSTSIRRGRSRGHEHDDPDPVGPENPDNIQTMKRILISLWSPYARFVSKWYTKDQELQVRLKNTDQVVQKVIGGNEEDMGSAAPLPTKSGVSILKSLRREMLEIDDLRMNSYAITSSSSVFAGEVVSLMDSVLQNLNDTFIFLAEDNTRINSATRILHVKEEQVEGLKERLIVFRNFLCLIPNRLVISDQECAGVFDTAQMIVLKVPPLLYVVVCSIINGVEELAVEFGDAFLFVVAGINNVIG
ncbi:hypothetical protein ACH5RR_002946 [Cinchona calisaya]|uniref:Uncharacterized protein n=1 Tax=Cinchona calisaya TaxID=153742 RepID=A0ABD3ATJ1_9GENT